MINKHITLPLFHTSAAQEFLATPAKLPGLLQTLRKAIQTGLVELSWEASDKRYVILIAGGETVNIYSLHPPVRRILPNARLEKLIKTFPPEEKVKLRVLSLTPQTIRLSKIWIEHQYDGTPDSMPTSQLEEHLAELIDGGLSLVHYSWPSAEALVMVPGNGEPPSHLLFISNAQIIHSASGIMALLGWNEPDCKITVVQNREASQAWDEYKLHNSFVLFMSRLLPRVEELAGRMTTSAIIREINFTASAHGWNLNMAPTSVTDQAIFTSPEDAADVYRRFISVATQRAEALLGEQAAQLIVREAISGMPAPFRQTFTRYLHVDIRLSAAGENTATTLSVQNTSLNGGSLRL